MIDVALTPAELRPADVAVVIDVLRATSTVAEALTAGYERVLCVASIEQAESLRAPGRVVAGERSCLMPRGFDQGNSPLEAMVRRGRELVLATTNGAPAVLAAAHHAREVMLGCLLNLGCVLEALSDLGDLDQLKLQLVCSGTDGFPTLEDTYLAGLLSAGLPGARTDAARIAEAVTAAYPTASAALGESGGAIGLRRAGLDRDIAHCALVSRLNVVPRVAGLVGEIAVVEFDRGSTAERPPSRQRAAVGGAA